MLRLAQTLDTMTTTAPEFIGTKDQQQLAEQLWHVFKIQGRFFGERAPIRMNVEQLVAFMEQRQPSGKDWAKRIPGALSRIQPSLRAKSSMTRSSLRRPTSGWRPTPSCCRCARKF